MYANKQCNKNISRTISSCKKKLVQPISIENIMPLRQKEHHICNLNPISIIQREVPTENNQYPRPIPELAQPYTPHGKNTPVTSAMQRPTWQEGYRDAVFQKWFSTSDKEAWVTDVTGKTLPLWAIELDHIVPWDAMKKIMADDGDYSVYEAKLYFHDIENLQPLNSYDNKIKSNNEDSPDYSVPHLNNQLGELPNVALKSVSELVFDVNNVAPFIDNDNTIQFFANAFNLIISAVDECRSEIFEEELSLDIYNSEQQQESFVSDDTDENILA